MADFAGRLTRAGICAHVLDGIPLNNKKTVKKAETLKRRASEGAFSARLATL